jgi:NitT/TauT family transport system substrate-binding protein
MSPSDGTAGLLSGGRAFDSAFTIPPFQEMQLNDPAIHTVLDSKELLGSSSTSYARASKKFHEANPKVFLALVNAMKEASTFLFANKERMVSSYLVHAGEGGRRVDPENSGRSGEYLKRDAAGVREMGDFL